MRKLTLTGILIDSFHYITIDSHSVDATIGLRQNLNSEDYIMPKINRRRFLEQTAVTSAVAFPAVLTQKGLAAKGPASERVRVGMVGAAGRAGSLNRIFARNKNAEIVGIAEIDPRRLPGTLENVTKTQGSKPKTFTDFRKLADDPTIDALCVGTPDHWHAIPSIMGCLSGKDVYVEKPDSHNIVEGARMVAAMRKHKRIIQMGSQHRSTERMQSALAYIREGHLGKCLVAKAWESTKPRSALRNFLTRSYRSELPDAFLQIIDGSALHPFRVCLNLCEVCLLLSSSCNVTIFPGWLFALAKST